MYYICKKKAMRKTRVNLQNAEAMASLRHGRRVTQIELAEMIWPDRDPVNSRMALRHLISGKTQRIDARDVGPICEVLGIDPNQLFNW